MTAPVLALYTGCVQHRRLVPRRHQFTYPVFMALLDLDHLQEAMAASRLLGYNRFAWASYNDRDHLGDPTLPLRTRFQVSAEAQGLTFPDGPVYLLANLRFWGYCINPVSYVYAYDARGGLALIGAEVVNTPWKERIVYWMRPEAKAGTLAFTVAKAMHVSPFMPMDLQYRWTFSQPGADLEVRMALRQGTERLFDADLKLTRRPWSGPELTRVLFSYPFHTFKVVFAIHWEALKLWIKRVPVFTHPPASRPTP